MRLLCDLQPDNIGWVRGAWRLFDGGFCVPLHEKWRDLWEEVGADAGRWFDRGAKWEKLLWAWGELTEAEALAEPT